MGKSRFSDDDITKCVELYKFIEKNLSKIDEQRNSDAVVTLKKYKTFYGGGNGELISNQWNDEQKNRFVSMNMRVYAPTISASAKKVTVVMPPGHGLSLFAGFFFSKKKYEGVFLPMLEDMRHEYYLALSKESSKKAMWIRISYYYVFTKMLFSMLTGSLISEVIKMLKTN